jgi:hypothetical protein
LSKERPNAAELVDEALAAAKAKEGVEGLKLYIVRLAYAFNGQNPPRVVSVLYFSKRDKETQETLEDALVEGTDNFEWRGAKSVTYGVLTEDDTSTLYDAAADGKVAVCSFTEAKIP